MKLRSRIFIVAASIFIFTACNHKPPGPDDDHEIDGRVTIWVTDAVNHPVPGAEISTRELGSLIYFDDSTNPFGTTGEQYFSGDTATGAEVSVRRPGYVPLVDTFYLELVQPQLVHIILTNDIGLLTGKYSFTVLDTTGRAIPDAELYATWYPGPGWNSTWSIITESDTLGQISNRTFIVDSSRNFISAGFSKNGYQTLVDTLIIMKDTMQDFNIILKKE